MTSYTPNIPQPGDDPSDSQDQLLQNFQTLQSSYGTSGDHYPWTNTTPTEGLKHAKVTLPGLPTTNQPGNIMPSPLAGNCAIFGITRDSQTTPFLSRDGLPSPTPPDFVNIWPILPIKGYAAVSILNTLPLTGSILDGFNLTLTSVTSVGNLISANFAFINDMRNSNYGVIALLNKSSNNYFYTITNQHVFSVSVQISGSTLPYLFTVIAIES